MPSLSARRVKSCIITPDETGITERLSMIYRNILVPFDGDEPSEKALDIAKRFIIDDPESVVHVVTIVDAGTLATQMQSPTERKGLPPMLFPNADEYTEAIDVAVLKAKEKIDDTATTLSSELKAQVKVQAVVSAKVAAGIIDFAEQNRCDLIIMSRHGHSILHGPLGSVSYSVLQKANVPVLMI